MKNLIILFMVLENLVCPIRQRAWHSNTALTISETTRLVGGEISLDDAVTKADAIFIATIVDMGTASFSGAGQTKYSHVKVRISQLLKGSANDTDNFRIVVRSVKPSEVTPSKEKEYIFFVFTEGGANTVSKLLDASTVQIDEVRHKVTGDK